MSTALANRVNLDEKMIETNDAIVMLANDLPEEVGERVLELCKFIQPTIKGLEAPQRASIPQIYLNQTSSSADTIPADCKKGDMYINGETIGKTIDVIPILTYNIRRKWGDAQIECASLDGVTGSRYGACETCPYGRFEKGVAPQCSQGTAFYVVKEDLTALYRIEFIKSSAKAGRTIRKLIAPPALWSRSFTISTEHHKDSTKNYYTFKASPTGRKTEEPIMQVCDALHGFFHAVYHKALESVQEASQAGGPTPAAVVTENESDVIDFSDGM